MWEVDRYFLERELQRRRATAPTPAEQHRAAWLRQRSEERRRTQRRQRRGRVPFPR